MLLIGFNHRGLGEGGLPTGQGAVGGLLYNAFSRGEVSLASADPDVDPLVEENMLDDDADRQRMRDLSAPPGGAVRGSRHAGHRRQHHLLRNRPGDGRSRRAAGGRPRRADVAGGGRLPARRRILPHERL